MSATRCSLRLCFWGLLTLGLGCREGASGRVTPAGAGEPDAAPPWRAQSRAPTPPRGMVWVPEGALVAGTPEGRLPRLPDQEMAGEQMVLHGFFIDVFAYPNEEGAIPTTGLTRPQAEAACAEHGKRLCTELEWERACKGPENTTYEYGERYRSDVCLTGRAPRMLPSGFRQGCRSEFGARDMHGTVWEWTASRFGRGGDGSLVALRGGNGDAGEVIGRCANAVGRAPTTRSSQIGFRCCMGEPNEAVVSLKLERTKSLEQREVFEPSWAAKLEGLAPPEVNEGLSADLAWRAASLWDWRPVANAHLVVAGGCAGAPAARRCGALIADLVAGEPQYSSWAWVGLWPPTLRVSSVGAQKLWVYGGDRTSPLRQAALFEWGRVRLGEMQRRFGTSSEWHETRHPLVIDPPARR
jgi:formylglycine-generating enzyme